MPTSIKFEAYLQGFETHGDVLLEVANSEKFEAYLQGFETGSGFHRKKPAKRGSKRTYKDLKLTTQPLIVFSINEFEAYLQGFETRRRRNDSRPSPRSSRRSSRMSPWTRRRGPCRVRSVPTRI